MCKICVVSTNYGLLIPPPKWGEDSSKYLKQKSLLLENYISILNRNSASNPADRPKYIVRNYNDLIEPLETVLYTGKREDSFFVKLLNREYGARIQAVPETNGIDSKIKFPLFVGKQENDLELVSNLSGYDNENVFSSPNTNFSHLLIYSLGRIALNQEWGWGVESNLLGLVQFNAYEIAIVQVDTPVRAKLGGESQRLLVASSHSGLNAMLAEITSFLSGLVTDTAIFYTQINPFSPNDILPFLMEKILDFDYIKQQILNNAAYEKELLKDKLNQLNKSYEELQTKLNAAERYITDKMPVPPQNGK